MGLVGRAVGAVPEVVQGDLQVGRVLQAVLQRAQRGQVFAVFAAEAQRARGADEGDVAVFDSGQVAQVGRGRHLEHLAVLDGAPGDLGQELVEGEGWVQVAEEHGARELEQVHAGVGGGVGQVRHVGQGPHLGVHLVGAVHVEAAERRLRRLGVGKRGAHRGRARRGHEQVGGQHQVGVGEVQRGVASRGAQARVRHGRVRRRL